MVPNFFTRIGETQKEKLSPSLMASPWAATILRIRCSLWPIKATVSLHMTDAAMGAPRKHRTEVIWKLSLMTFRSYSSTPWDPPGYVFSLPWGKILADFWTAAWIWTTWSSSLCRTRTGMLIRLRSSVKSVSDKSFIQSYVLLKLEFIPCFCPICICFCKPDLCGFSTVWRGFFAFAVPLYAFTIIWNPTNTQPCCWLEGITIDLGTSIKTESWSV